jgi:NADH-quinone oxidoreductase subunit L
VVSYNLFDWVPAGVMHTNAGDVMRFNVPWGVLIDPLTCVMLFVVTGVGFLIHVYSTGYMSHEGGYYRFFGYLNLFMFSMLTLITANNLLLLFVGWEGVGLCSYLLIGFYFLRKSASDAGKKAFIVNRIGDAGFILGLFLMLGTLGTIQFTEIGPAISAGHFVMGDATLTAIALLLFVGATGKSAQLPLYVWLPDAMEGPTPVSALIHAATMVTAGVYMIVRTNAVFSMAPKALGVIAVVGVVTSIFAATMGLVQNDIKRVLAYSTVSQLGYMFLACGVGAFTAGVFHLMTHAFFKACLFLGSGSVIHALSGEQDMRKMGGLWGKIPTTAKTFFVASIAIAGIPPLAGFVSKDSILGHAFEYSPILWLVGFITAGMTAFYMFRLVNMTFFGKSRVDHEVEHHIHESPKSMTWPLVILAFFSIFAGYLNVSESMGGAKRIDKFLEPVFAGTTEKETPAGESGPGLTEYLLMGLSIAAAGAGWLMARSAYGNAGKGYTEPIAAAAPPVYDVLLNKYYVDEGYDYLVTGRRKLGDVRLGVMGLGEASSWFDSHVIDGAVNGAGWITRVAATFSSWWDKWIIDGIGVNGPAILARMLSYPARLFEWGLVQWYALVMTAGLVGFAFYYVYH